MSELGNKLRDARIEKGYTLNTLQQKTKIQKKYLQAIENGELDQLPGQYYVRAFVKQYADVVGLNGDQLLQDYEMDLKQPKSDSNLLEKSSIPSRLERHQQYEKSQWEQALSHLPMVLLSGIILLIIGTLIFAIRSLSQNEKQVVEESSNALVSVLEPDTVVIEDKSTEAQTTEESLEEGQIKVGDQVITLISEPTGETVYQLEGPIDKYKFEVKADKFVWAGIYEDEIMKLDTTITEGESVDYQASPTAQSVRMRLGYVEGGKFYVNGTKLELASDYIKETVLFVAKEETESTVQALDIPEESSQAENTDVSTEGYQGPAVYDPNYSE